jgi:hypothetical protein
VQALTDFFVKAVTIYNLIPATATTEKIYNRTVLEKCQVQGVFVEKTQDTVRNVVNAKSVITKSVEHYLDFADFVKIPVDKRSDYWSVNVGDFIVFAEVDDYIETEQDFANLQKKYRNNGIKVTTANASVYGMATDNVQMTNA